MDKTMKVDWEGQYCVGTDGEKIGYFPVCPYCGEMAYEEDRCVFCGKPYELDWSRMPSTVRLGDSPTFPPLKIKGER